MTGAGEGVRRQGVERFTSLWLGRTPLRSAGGQTGYIYGAKSRSDEIVE